ncbi:MAG: hypothetical protein ABFE07_00690, partial [Armatimonadia bacterium]
SRVMRRGEVRERLRWLILREKAQQGDPVVGKPMGIPDKIVELERIIRNGTPSDRVRAIQEHNRLTGQGRPTSANAPDPAFLAEFLRRAEDLGLEPVHAAQEARDGNGNGAAPDDLLAAPGVPGDDDPDAAVEDADGPVEAPDETQSELWVEDGK